MNPRDWTQLPERRDKDHNISHPLSRLTSRVETQYMTHPDFVDKTSKNVKSDPSTELHRQIMMEMDNENIQHDHDEENVKILTAFNGIR